MQALIDAAWPVRDASVPDSLRVTWRNAANPRVYQRGPEIFGAKADRIAEAKREVLYQTFVWEPGSVPTQTLLRGLSRLQGQRRRNAKPGDPPVRVRIVIDASDTGAFALPFPDGVQQVTRSLEDLHLDPELVEWEVAGYTHLSTGNLHSKVLVVDGDTVIVTGANPQTQHQGENPWYDLGYEARGEVAMGMRAELADAWSRALQWTCPTWPYYRESCTRRAQPLPPLPALLPAELSDACVPMMVIGRGADENPVGNSKDNTQDATYLAALHEAGSIVRIQTPNLNDDDVKRAIVQAAADGVEVRVVVSRDFNRLTTSLPLQGGHNEHNVNDLYRQLELAGVEAPCEVLRLRWFSEDGDRPVRGNGPGASHAKYASFDGQVTIVGSTNMDGQSFHRSREVDIVTDDAATAVAWDAVFDNAWGNGVLPENCGGRKPLVPSPTWGDLLASLTPREPKPKPYFSASHRRFDKQFGDWHVDLGMFDSRIYESDSRETTRSRAFELQVSRGLGTGWWFSRLGLENDDLYSHQDRFQLQTGVRRRLAGGSRARLEMGLGAGYDHAVDTDTRERLQGVAGLAAARFAWLLHRDLALRQEVSVLANPSWVRFEAVSELRSSLTDDWELSLGAWLRWDPLGFDPRARVGFRIGL